MLIKSLDHKQVLSLLPERLPESHKGDFGKILLLCGSRGFTGAAALAAMGALRTGAGLVYMGVPEDIYQIEKLTHYKNPNHPFYFLIMLCNPSYF